MKRIDLLKIIANGGATLDASGAAVSFRRGYQVSRKDCYTLNVRNTNKILRAVRSVLADLKAGEYCGIWVDGGRVYVDISERIPRPVEQDDGTLSAVIGCGGAFYPYDPDKMEYIGTAEKRCQIITGDFIEGYFSIYFQATVSRFRYDARNTEQQEATR